jgi:hypothetical protein
MIDPSKALQDLLGGGSLEDSLYPLTSRYHGIEVATTSSGGQTVAFLRRRFVPAPERFDTLAVHVTDQADRLDRLAARYLGDPELFWRIADANAARRPDELTEEPGRRLRITLPEGVPGAKAR